ncbi:copper resistance protein NlpE N-terminal domain-containing protein [Salegentibacter sp. BDJ18]|uniref:copper resistance protein NlpE n=1 Tax=Salegentibacter sp. BDJ18 TaxID=2816376 RepID=UPI001AAE637E|nr:copper resistance protein NlpE [Salegentibacter sp. BDJ18]MBO2544213.1 copper resistance protein NlpE N-terminal domain-containing protein [Salegentibacter sp. BDJ18]
MKSIIILLALVCLVSCKDENKELELETTEISKKSEITPSNDVFSARDSLDWTGIYEGFLPCEDCEGIETSIEIEKNRDYTLSQEFKGRAGDNSLQETGKFKWDKQGNTISLGERQKLYFQVSQNYLLQVFKDESKVMGDSAIKYRLTKINEL